MNRAMKEGEEQYGIGYNPVKSGRWQMTVGKPVRVTQMVIHSRLHREQKYGPFKGPTVTEAIQDFLPVRD